MGDGLIHRDEVERVVDGLELGEPWSILVAHQNDANANGCGVPNTAPSVSATRPVVILRIIRPSLGSASINQEKCPIHGELASTDIGQKIYHLTLGLLCLRFRFDFRRTG